MCAAEFVQGILAECLLKSKVPVAMMEAEANVFDGLGRMELEKLVHVFVLEIFSAFVAVQTSGNVVEHEEL